MLRWALCWCIFSLGVWAQEKNARSPQGSGEFSINGTVVDSVTSQPLANTRVAIAPVSQRDAFTTISTGEDGRFFFPAVAPGKYTLTAQRRGYLTQTFEQHEQFATSIAVGPALNSSDLVFRLTSESAISGAVTDEQGDAVRNARVLLFQISFGEGLRSTRQRAAAVTDDEGFYHFAHLPAGKYFVAVSAEPWYAQRATPDNGQVAVADGNALSISSSSTHGGVARGGALPPPEPPSLLDVAYPVTFYPGATDAAAATAITLGKGERASADVVMHPVPAVRVRVAIDNAEQGQQLFAVLEERLFDGVPASVSTRTVQIAPGVLEVTGVVPGHYIMKINSWNDSHRQAVQEREGDVSGSGEMDALRINSNVSINAVMRFEPPAAASDRLFLRLRDKKSGQVFSERLNDKGEAGFKEGVRPGIYEVSLQGGQDMFIKSILVTGARATGRTVEVKNGTVKLSLVVAQGEGELSGTALRDGKPVAGAMIVLVPADPANNQVLFRRNQTDSDGSFGLSNVVPGRYTLVAIEDGRELEWANPTVLRKFMAQGEIVTIEPKGKYTVKVKVQ